MRYQQCSKEHTKALFAHTNGTIKFSLYAYTINFHTAFYKILFLFNLTVFENSFYKNILFFEFLLTRPKSYHTKKKRNFVALNSKLFLPAFVIPLAMILLTSLILGLVHSIDCTRFDLNNDHHLRRRSEFLRNGSNSITPRMAYESILSV